MCTLRSWSPWDSRIWCRCWRSLSTVCAVYRLSNSHASFCCDSQLVSVYLLLSSWSLYSYCIRNTSNGTALTADRQWIQLTVTRRPDRIQTSNWFVNCICPHPTATTPNTVPHVYIHILSARYSVVDTTLHNNYAHKHHGHSVSSNAVKLSSAFHEN